MEDMRMNESFLLHLLDLNRDGEIDAEELAAGAVVVGALERKAHQRAEYAQLQEEEAAQDQLLESKGLDPFEVELMNDAERKAALTEAGIDPNTYKVF